MVYKNIIFVYGVIIPNRLIFDELVKKIFNAPVDQKVKKLRELEKFFNIDYNYTDHKCDESIITELKNAKRYEEIYSETGMYGIWENCCYMLGPCCGNGQHIILGKEIIRYKNVGQIHEIYDVEEILKEVISYPASEFCANCYGHSQMSQRSRRSRKSSCYNCGSYERLNSAQIDFSEVGDIFDLNLIERIKNGEFGEKKIYAVLDDCTWCT